ncbi:Probable 39S ribosomal protein L49, mitochondrial [Sergentomyia squamirostris]
MANLVCLSKLRLLAGFSGIRQGAGGAEMVAECLRRTGMIGWCAGSAVRHSSFRSSPAFGHLDDHPPVEIAHNPPEWKFVERLLPPATVPTPRHRPNYPSGWRPQQPNITSSPYFIARTRNHMIPVYLKDKFRGSKKITVIHKIQGDIFLLHAELEDLVQKAAGRKILSRLNEMRGTIEFTGAFANLIKNYLQEKGF